MEFFHSPTIAYNFCWLDLNHIQLFPGAQMEHHINDIYLWRDSFHIFIEDIQIFTQELKKKGVGIYLYIAQGFATPVEFLRIIW